MKKATAIFFSLLFLFNLVGYRFVFNYAQQRADRQLEASLDNHQYNDADLIAITIPLSMPYQTLQSDFERVDGEVTVNGKILKYVKRKIVDGQLILMCLPDHNKMQLQSAKDDFFKTSTDIAQSNTSKKSDASKNGAFKNAFSDFDKHLSEVFISFRIPNGKPDFHLVNNTLLTLPHTPQVPPPNIV